MPEHGEQGLTTKRRPYSRLERDSFRSGVLKRLVFARRRFPGPAIAKLDSARITGCGSGSRSGREFERSAQR
jgi:hypothetical protein